MLDLRADYQLATFYFGSKRILMLSVRKLMKHLLMRKKRKKKGKKMRKTRKKRKRILRMELVLEVTQEKPRKLPRLIWMLQRYSVLSLLVTTVKTGPLAVHLKHSTHCSLYLIICVTTSEVVLFTSLLRVVPYYLLNCQWSCFVYLFLEWGWWGGGWCWRRWRCQGLP